MKISILFLLLSAAAAVLVYLLFTNSSEKKTERNAGLLFLSAQTGSPLAEALEASPNFHSIHFGSCGYIAVSAAARDKSPLIFFPRQGDFEKFSSIAEFLARNPSLFQNDEKCRKISVLYMAAFPYRGLVTLEVNKAGRILKAQEPAYFD